MQRMVSEMSMILANECRLAGLAFTFSLGVLLQLLVNPCALSLHSILHLQPLSNVRVVCLAILTYSCFTGVHTMAQLVAITDRFFPASQWHNCAVCSSMWLSRATCSKYTVLTCFVLQLSCMSWSQCPTCSLGQGPRLQPQSMVAVVWLVGAFFAKIIGKCLHKHCACVQEVIDVVSI